MCSDPSEAVRQAELLEQRGDHAAALSLLLKYEAAQSQTDRDPYEQAKSLNHIAYLAMLAKDLPQAERSARKCLEVFGPPATHRDEEYAAYLMMLASVLAEQQQFEQAIPLAEEALSHFSNAFGEKSRFVQDRKKDLDRLRQGLPLED